MQLLPMQLVQCCCCFTCMSFDKVSPLVDDGGAVSTGLPTLLHTHALVYVYSLVQFNSVHFIKVCVTRQLFAMLSHGHIQHLFSHHQ
jgi:hypothetical protein